MHNSLPLTRDLVLVGGGHTHALVLRMWGMARLPGARLTLIDPNPTAAYSGMLPGHIAGHYDRRELDIDLVRLARFAGARLILGAAEGIDLTQKVVKLANRPAIPFDVLSLDVGITSDMPDLPGFREHAVPAKPLGPFAAAWSQFQEAVSEGRSQPRIVVIGAGVAGVELALAMSHRMKQRGFPEHRVTLIDSGPVLHTLPSRTREALLAALAQANIETRENATVEQIAVDHVALTDGQMVDFAFCVGTAGARAHGWLGHFGLELTDGFVTVSSDLSSPTHPHVFAVGDCAHMAASPRPKAGVYAVRQAPVLFHNLCTALQETGARRRYRPQDDYLKLISLGGKRAIASKWGLSVAGAWCWRLKDRIDQKFMAHLSVLPDVKVEALPASTAAGVRDAVEGNPPLCGGCGSKVSSATLTQALATLSPTSRSDVLSQPGDDAALLQHGARVQVVTTDHLRAVTEDPWMMAKISAIHALGDIWAMGATPQAAFATIILPQASEMLQSRMITEITQAAAEVFSAHGADLAGGHSTLGTELSIGFTVTGLADAPIRQDGASDSDGLILTKPIGSGILLAGEMRGRSQGLDMADLYTEMVQSQAAAADLLSKHAHAMTDVTGFGLAGHLLSICSASGLSADIDPNAVPLYPGAEDLAAAGIRSSIWAANKAETAPRIHGLSDSARHNLLFDPQTCGGLLAAVPKGEVEKLLQELRSVESHAAFIGVCRTGTPELHLRTLS
ncbi:MAG: selenide, water dikinase SelD [Pseudomonadota bacterium]